MIIMPWFWLLFLMLAMGLPVGLSSFIIVVGF